MKTIVNCNNCNYGNRWYNGFYIGIPSVFIPLIPAKKEFNIHDDNCFICPECGCNTLSFLEED